MSLTSQQLLDIAEAVSGMMALGTNIDWAIPAPNRFADKSGFWSAFDDAKDTKTEIETTLIRAAWLRYLNFEDEAGEDIDAREVDGPIRTLIYEITVFHEGTQVRLDQTATPDAFNKQILLSHHEHVAAVMSLLGEFQGVTPIPALSAYAVADIIGLVQLEDTDQTVCPFIPSLTGDLTKLECRVQIQMPC